MSGTVRFEILGPQRAWYDDQELDTGPGKQRAVLAVLLLATGRPVPTGQIVEAVWPDDPPANGPNVVQKYVAGLRRVLEPERSPRTPGQVLTLSDAGYLLRVTPESVDAVAFERAVRRAQRLRSEGRVAEAVTALRSALELWRGEPLAGLPGPFFESARHRLVELRAAALETRAELDLELGRHRELVGELVELVVEFPLRERLRHQLMLALHRSGRQAEALAGYREYGDLLREEFGIEPGDALQDLHRRILRSDPTLMPAAAVPLPPAGRATDSAPPTASVEPTVSAAPNASVEPTVSAAPNASVEPTVSAAPNASGKPTASAEPPAPAASAPPARVAADPTPPTPPPATPQAVSPAASPAWPSVAPPAVPPPAIPPPVSAAPAPFPAYLPPPAGPSSFAGPPPAADGRWPKTPMPRWASATATVVGTVLVLLSLGCLTWLVILLYAAWRRSWRLALAGVGYLAVLVLEVSLLDIEHPEAEPSAATSVVFLGLVVFTWLIGAVHVVLLSRGVWATLTGGPGSAKDRAEEERRIRREHSRYLLYHYPAARGELRIGRPDLPRSFDDGGLIDVNAVPEQVLAGLPGLTAEQCRQMVVDRWLRGPYSSLEELAGRCLLPPNVTEPLRDLLFFLPPTPAATPDRTVPPPGS
ncbi:BTAD domain-containing putative transcriptional regulator [Micromonospora sp. NPDC048909]|uniref:BTAD domain-containing putative transcriptional regulator n=1 Tax=Micromonospora sp. NPDC048909 TaxID=3155643 RepID=UPI0033C91456